MPSLLRTTQNTRQALPGSFRYLRSDAPIRPDAEDIAYLLAHDVRTLIDLRSEEERLRKPCPLAEHAGFTYHALPVTGGNAVPDTPEDVPRSYLRMADEQMARILRVIESAETNVLFFCTAGKDRTGVVSALLQRRTGLDRDEIMADYVRSAENLQERLAAFLARRPDVDPAIITPQAHFMEEFLDLLDTKKGSSL